MTLIQTSEPTRQDAIRALQTLSAVSTQEVSAIVLVTQTPGKTADIWQLQPTKAAVAPVTTVARSAAVAYRECEVMDYDPAGSPGDGQVMWLSTDFVPLLSRILGATDDLANLPRFEPDKSHMKGLRLAALRTEADRIKTLFVQGLQHGQVVARTTKVGVIIREGVLDVPKGEVVILNSDVIAVLTGRYVFFRNRAAFQQLFNLLEAIREQAASTFREAVSNLRIEGMEEMLTVVTGAPAMLGKIASIQRKIDTYPKYREAMTMPRLTKFILDHPECGVDLAGEGDGVRLRVRERPTA